MTQEQDVVGGIRNANIEVTDQMIDAGRALLHDWLEDRISYREDLLLAAIFQAMSSQTPPTP